MTVPEFPNFFMLYGPGTNLASGGSLIFHSECEVRYIMALSGPADRGGQEERWNRVGTATTTGTTAARPS